MPSGLHAQGLNARGRGSGRPPHGPPAVRRNRAPAPVMRNPHPPHIHGMPRFCHTLESASSAAARQFGAPQVFITEQLRPPYTPPANNGPTSLRISLPDYSAIASGYSGPACAGPVVKYPFTATGRPLQVCPALTSRTGPSETAAPRPLRPTFRDTGTRADGHSSARKPSVVAHGSQM